MLIGRMLAPVTALGPGKRVCLWLQGCRKRCAHCMSPELQPFTGSHVPVEQVAALLIDAADRNQCQGLTVSGGEPFDQQEELSELLKRVRSRFPDILVYTGYRYEEVKDSPVLAQIDVLIEGPYQYSLNDPARALAGSRNQRILYLTEGVQTAYETYQRGPRKVDLFNHNGTFIRVGILNEGD